MGPHIYRETVFFKYRLIRLITGTKVRFKYIFAFVYRNLVYLYLKITKRHIFDLYLKNICKYNQIYIQITTKSQTLPDINWLRSQDRMFFTPGQEWAGSIEKIGQQ